MAQKAYFFTLFDLTRFDLYFWTRAHHYFREKERRAKTKTKRAEKTKETDHDRGHQVHQPLHRRVKVRHSAAAPAAAGEPKAATARPQLPPPPPSPPASQSSPERTGRLYSPRTAVSLSKSMSTKTSPTSPSPPPPTLRASPPPSSPQKKVRTRSSYLFKIWKCRIG